MKGIGLCRSLAVVALLICPPLFAQTSSIVRPKTYGTTRVTVTKALASDFVPPSSDVGWSTFDAGGVFRYQTTPGSARWWAPLRVPDGAAVETVELDACDLTPSGQIVFGLRRTVLETGEDILPLGGTGVAATGCGYYPVVLDDPLTVDSSNYNYSFFVQWEGDFSSDNRIQAVNVYYKLQVSPPPGSPTFNDVPTGHLFFQFVEALAYSGITAGCGGPNFCPDAPLTRGQMAVFLAKALGLSWP